MKISFTNLPAILVVLFCAVHYCLAASQRSSIKKVLRQNLENATNPEDDKLAVIYQFGLPENIDNNLILNDVDDENDSDDEDDYDDDNDNDSIEVLYDNENYLINGADAKYADETGIGARDPQRRRYRNRRVRPSRRRRKNRRIRRIRVIRKNRRNRIGRIVIRPIN